MKDIREVFQRIQDQKREQRELAASVRDSLRNSMEYRDLVDKINQLKSKKVQLEHSAGRDVGEKIDLLKLNIKDGQDALADIALSTLMRGEPVKLTDAEENEYEPIFSVRFKKTGKNYAK